MQSRVAIVENGVVWGVIVVDDEILWAPTPGQTAVPVADDDPAGPGDTYDGRFFTRPPEPERALLVDESFVKQLVSDGVVTTDEVTAAAVKLGYTADEAAKIVTEVTATAPIADPLVG